MFRHWLVYLNSVNYWFYTKQNVSLNFMMSHGSRDAMCKMQGVYIRILCAVSVVPDPFNIARVDLLSFFTGHD